MCKYRYLMVSLWDGRDGYEEGSAVNNSDLPRVLIAITAIKQRADMSLEDIYNMNEIMRKTKYIMSNIVIIHRNIRENSVIALKRIDRLSDHLDTYRKIVAQVHYEIDIRGHLDSIVTEIAEIRRLNDEFGNSWSETERKIDNCFEDFADNYKKIMDCKRRALTFMSDRDFLKVGEVCAECRIVYRQCKDLDQRCNEWCKESGDRCSDLCDKVNQLESTFNSILKQSLDSMQSARQKAPEDDDNTACCSSSAGTTTSADIESDEESADSSADE